MTKLQAFLNKQIQDPDLRVLAGRATNALQMSLAKAIGAYKRPGEFKINPARSSIESLYLKRFQRLGPDLREAAYDKVRPILDKTPQQRREMFGDVGLADLKSEIPIQRQVLSMNLPAELAPVAARMRQKAQAALQQDTVALRAFAPPGVIDTPIIQPRPGVPAPPPRNERVELRIRSVECIETTREITRDDIYLAGIATDLCTGVSSLISPFKVGDFNARRRSTVTYSPPRRFASFTLKPPPADLQTYAVTLVLAEKDLGGLDKHLADLHTTMDRQLVEELVVGFIVSLLGTPGVLTIVASDIAKGVPVLKTAMRVLGVTLAFPAIVIGAVIYLLIDVLPKVVRDDIFPEVVVTQPFGPPGNRLPNRATSTESRLEPFEGFGGLYQLRYDWAVVS